MAQPLPTARDATAMASTCEKLNSAAEKLFTNPMFADLTIKCGSRQWHVNKVIICMQSSYFAKAVGGTFMEANDHAITLHEDDEDAVNAMLEFFYTQDYTLSVGKGDPSGLSFHIVAYHLAGKYMLATTLQELAARKFSANAEEAWPTTAFTDAISKVFELADAQGDALTAAVIRISKENLTLLMENQSGFKKVLAEEPALAAAIVEHNLQKLEAVEEERDAAKKKPERTDRGVKYFKCCHYGCSFGGIGSCTFMLSSMVSRGPLYCPLCGSGHISTSSANERLV